MEQKEVINGLSDLTTDNNRDRQFTDEPTLAGTLAAVCENLGQTLQLLATQVDALNNVVAQPTDNIIDDVDELWDRLHPKVEELVKETIREADVDLDLDISVDSITASLRV
tara:strand:+ start:392 stop:724 length:333 start_codon:yes stop_codon:yes gene_type:complete